MLLKMVILFVYFLYSNHNSIYFSYLLPGIFFPAEEFLFLNLYKSTE